MRVIFPFFCLLLLLNLNVSGQSCTKTMIIGSDTVIVDPEKIASFEKGREEYMGWISNHMNPKLRGNEEATKKVFVGFIINERGQISGFEIIRGQGDPYDTEAINLIKKHPHKWIPAQCGERKVKTRMILPIRFHDL